MNQPIRAIYRDGHLDLLDKVEFREDQVILLNFSTEHEEVRVILGDLLEPREDDDLQITDDLDDLDDDALLAIIQAGSKDVTSTSDAIIAERQEGP